MIAGGLAPLGRTGKPAPLSFMKKVLEASVSFDIWAHHPYTSGGPLHRSAGKGDVTLGNLGEMRTLLMSKDSKINNDMPLQFWVTEFSWDSKPPDPDALGQPLHRRWVSEALYRMWSAGVSLVTWFRLEDDPLTGPLGTPYQSGFYTTSGSPKASLQAFRFPTVALTKRGGILVWGRTPGTTATSVTIQIKTGRTWKKLSTLNSNGQGIFTKTYRVPYKKGYIRAKASGAVQRAVLAHVRARPVREPVRLRRRNRLLTSDRLRRPLAGEPCSPTDPFFQIASASPRRSRWGTSRFP